MTFSSTVHVTENLYALECPREEPEPGDFVRRGGVVQIVPAEVDRPARLGFSAPEIRLKMVVFPAPLGPITTMMSPRLDDEIDIEDGHQAAVNPFLKLITSSSGTCTCISSIDCSRGSDISNFNYRGTGLPNRLFDEPDTAYRQPVGHEDHDGHDQNAERT